MPKRSLRSQLLAQRRLLSHDFWCASSRSAQLNVLSLVEYAEADCIALYAPAHNEIGTELIFTAAFQVGKQILYPAVHLDRMVFRRVERIVELKKGAFGILEPPPKGSDYHADEADLIVVPGISFDLAGHRIGYGKGFYDRFLSYPDCPTHLVGLCHDFQLTEELIPADAHDIPMEIIVSDKRIVRISGFKTEK